MGDAADNELDPELQAIAENQFLRQGETEPVGSEESGSGSSEPPASETSDQTPPTPQQIEEWAWEDGFKLTKEQARSYAELEAYLYANPDKAQALAQFLNGGTTEPTAGSSPQAPESKPEPPVEFTDPEVQAVYSELEKTRAQLEALQGSTSSVEQYVSTQQEQTATALYERARTSFKDQYHLSDEELAHVSDVAGRLQVLPSLMAPVDPITGQARKVDPLAAVEEALTIAYRMIPEYHDRIVKAEVDARNKDRARKARLSSLQGSSGSIPRENTPPSDPQSRRDAMIAEVAQMMGKGN